MALEIRSVRFDGHTTLSKAEVPLRRLNVLVGANGVGKSNFIHALELLGRIDDDELQLYVSLSGGAARLLRQAPTQADSMTLSLDLTLSSDAPLHFLVTLAPSADDELVFLTEEVTVGAGNQTFTVQLNRGGEREASPSRLVAQSGRSGVQEFAALAEAIKGCRVFHFHDTSDGVPMKGRQPTADNLSLRPHAENLAAVLLSLQETQPAVYRRILGTVQLAAPFLRDFVLQPEGQDTVRLRWRANDSDTVFSAHQMSDGTLRFICLATLLLHPVRPHLIVLDEPELGLHPFAIVQLVEMLRAASVESQVVVATQSVTLLDQLDLDDVIVVELEKGVSVFRRPERSDLEAWLADYSLGDMWLKNLIGGRPSRGQGGRA